MKVSKDVKPTIYFEAKRFYPSTIAVQPVGDVGQADLDWVREVLADVHDAETRVLPALGSVRDLKGAFNTERSQADADRILEHLFDALPKDASRILGVVDVDMFALGRTYVYGYASLRDHVAVISLKRLREEWYGRAADAALFRERVRKCVVHEVGHTFSVPHCEAVCVLGAVSSVESLDALVRDYCESCAKRVRVGLDTALESAEGQFFRGGACLRRYKIDRAVEHYREAARLAPNEARYQNDLGVALLSTGNRGEAQQVFLRAASLAADFPHPYYNLGILCRDGEGVEAAVRWFEEGLKRDKDPEVAHAYIARLYEELFDDCVRAESHKKRVKELTSGKSEMQIAALG